MIGATVVVTVKTGAIVVEGAEAIVALNLAAGARVTKAGAVVAPDTATDAPVVALRTSPVNSFVSNLQTLLSAAMHFGMPITWPSGSNVEYQAK